MSRTPNILFIITDQQRADHAGFMGSQVVRTPNLDRIAAGGMVFENAWVANPVCMPNRSSIMTGRLPTAHGVIFNDRSLDWGAATFVRQFRRAGYRTALIGKSHLQHGMSRNAMLPFRGQPVASSPYASGWDSWEHAERFADRNLQMPADFYGFEQVELAIDHGARVTGHHLHWALQAGGQRDELLVPYSEAAPGRHRSRHWWQVYQPPYAENLHSTHFVAERTLAFMEESRAAGQPWLVWSSFPDPHHPMTPPGDWFFRHSPKDMILPENRHDPLQDAPAHLQHFRGLHPAKQREWVTPCGYGNDELLAEAKAATCGMVEMIDDRIGRLTDALAASGQLDNTIIVFTSDHGDMMGEHGLFLKGFMHYRGTLQVPMLVSAPGLAPGRSQSLACSLDLGPTLMDLCGINGYDGIQGRSLVPILQDPAAEVRDHVLIEDDMPPVIERLTLIPAKIRTLITKRHRYTRNSKGEEQLFDLLDDPEEMSDLKRSDSVRSRVLEQLLDAMIAADDAARGAPATEKP